MDKVVLPNTKPWGRLCPAIEALFPLSSSNAGTLYSTRASQTFTKHISLLVHLLVSVSFPNPLLLPSFKVREQEWGLNACPLLPVPASAEC